MGVTMKKTGIVKEVNNAFALVGVSRKSACEGCHANFDGNCSACVIFGDKETFCKAENSIGAKVGDRVVVETASHTVILYAAAVFLFPVILAIIGYFVGTLISDVGAPIFGALIGFALAFVIVWLTLDRTASKRLDVKIVRILE